MATAAESQLVLTAPATDAGVNALVEEAHRFRDEWFARRSATIESTKKPHDAVTLHTKLRNGTRSREALELLPPESAGGVTPEELGLQMQPGKDGCAPDKKSARAALRVVLVAQDRLIKKGQMAAKVVDIDFGRYDVERAGRYFVFDDARKALDEYLQTT